MALYDMYGTDKGLSDYGHEQDQIASTQQAADLRNQFTQANNPQLLQHQALMNQTAQAELPGRVGLSQSQAAAGQIADAGKADTIAGNASSAQMAQKQQLGSKMYALGQSLQNVPAPARHAAFLDAVQQEGLDPSSPAVKQFANLAPDQLADALQTTGKAWATSSPANLQAQTVSENSANAKTDVQDQKNAASKYKTDEDNATKLAIAKQMASLRMQLKTALPNSNQRTTALFQIVSSGQATDAEKQELHDQLQAQMANRAVGVPQIAPTLVGTPTQTQVAQDTANTIAPSPAKSAPTQQMTQVGTSKGRPVYGTLGDPKTYHW